MFDEKKKKTKLGHAMAPIPFSIPSFVLTTIGTTFAVASANSLNQVLEVKYDAAMDRTSSRVLPSGQLR